MANQKTSKSKPKKPLTAKQKAIKKSIADVKVLQKAYRILHSPARNLQATKRALKMRVSDKIVKL